MSESDKNTLPSEHFATPNAGPSSIFFSERRLLNPVDRITEILYGLIMALTITCTISVSQARRTEITEMFFETLGTNIAWGLIDAVMYIITILGEKGHKIILLNNVRKSKNDQEAWAIIHDFLPIVPKDSFKEYDLESIRKALLQVPDSALQVRITWKEVKKATGIFFLMILSTFPVALPFVLVSNVREALRISNFLAIILMIICGSLLAKYGGYNKLLMSIAMALLGSVLVAITIILGG